MNEDPAIITELRKLLADQSPGSTAALALTRAMTQIAPDDAHVWNDRATTLWKARGDGSAQASAASDDVALSRLQATMLDAGDESGLYEASVECHRSGDRKRAAALRELCGALAAHNIALSALGDTHGGTPGVGLRQPAVHFVAAAEDYLRLGEVVRARALAERALKLAPDDRTAYALVKRLSP